MPGSAGAAGSRHTSEEFRALCSRTVTRCRSPAGFGAVAWAPPRNTRSPTSRSRWCASAPRSPAAAGAAPRTPHSSPGQCADRCRPHADEPTAATTPHPTRVHPRHAGSAVPTRGPTPPHAPDTPADTCLDVPLELPPAPTGTRSEASGKVGDPHWGGQPTAGVSTKWFRVAGTYGVEVGLGQVPVPILAGAAVPDMMAHEQRRPTRIVMSTSARLRRLIRSGRRRPAPRRSR